MMEEETTSFPFTDSTEFTRRIREMTPLQKSECFSNTNTGQHTTNPVSFLVSRTREGKILYRTLTGEDTENSSSDHKIVLPRFLVYDPKTGDAKKFPTAFVPRNVLEKINYNPFNFREQIRQLGQELLLIDQISDREGGGAAAVSFSIQTFTSDPTVYKTIDTQLLVIMLINVCFRDSKVIGRVATDVYLKSVCKFYNAFSNINVAQACVFGLYVLWNIGNCIKNKEYVSLIADELIFNNEKEFLEITDFNSDNETKKGEKLHRIMCLIDETKKMIVDELQLLSSFSS